MKIIATAAFLSTAVLFAGSASAATAVAPPKPQVAMGLQKIDTVVGKGKVAEAGKVVSVHYTGWLYTPTAPKQRGMQFDSSVGRGPFSFPLGGGQVIAGWDQGVQGMKVGGRRQLVIPPHLGYGDRGAGGVIKPGETLIFVVDLLEVK